MDQSTRTSARLHPLLWVAGVAVILLSLTGIAAMTGLLPRSNAPDAAPAATAKPGPVGSGGAADAVPTPNRPPVSARGDAAPAAGKAAPCAQCGVIEAIRQVTREGQGTGLGAIAGGVVGGVVGNQVGKGDGNTLATIAGAVGGGVIGNELEKKQRQTVAYRIVVRLDDGASKVVTANALPPWRVGDRVRLVNGEIAPL